MVFFGSPRNGKQLKIYCLRIYQRTHGTVHPRWELMSMRSATAHQIICLNTRVDIDSLVAIATAMRWALSFVLTLWAPYRDLVSSPTLYCITTTSWICKYLTIMIYMCVWARARKMEIYRTVKGVSSLAFRWSNKITPRDATQKSD